MKALKYILQICLIFTLVNVGTAVPPQFIPATSFKDSYQPAIVSANSPVNLSLEDFVFQIMDGNAEMIRGIYTADAFALRVVQQPSNQPGFVSTMDGVVTQFMDAKKYGSIGLLSHNFLSGKLFYQLKIGDVLQLVYGDGVVRKYQIESLHQYQALQPENPRSTFVDLATGTKLSAANLFLKMYARMGKLVLQTCLQKGDENSWGRLFIIAEPVM